MDQAELAAEKDAVFALLTELAAIDGVAGFEGPDGWRFGEQPSVAICCRLEGRSRL